MIKESCTLIGKEQLLFNNKRTYVINEETKLLTNLNTLNSHPEFSF